MVLTSSRVRSSCSRGMVIEASTSSGLPPFQTTRTVMYSNSKLGKNWALSLVSAPAPATIIMTISRLAATLWLAKVPNKSVLCLKGMSDQSVSAWTRRPSMALGNCVTITATPSCKRSPRTRTRD